MGRYYKPAKRANSTNLLVEEEVSIKPLRGFLVTSNYPLDPPERGRWGCLLLLLYRGIQALERLVYLVMIIILSPRSGLISIVMTRI